MKKILLITLAIVLILVGGIWLYLLLFGAPESSQEFFADLGFGSATAPTEFTNDSVPNDFAPVALETGIDTKKALNLLTLRPVAGAVIVGTSTDKQTVRYVERGTGQIYEIDLAANKETLLSDTTFAQATKATWSNNGTSVVIESGSPTSEQVQLLTWEKDSNASSTNQEGQFTASEIAPDAYAFAFSNDNKNLYYLRSDRDGSLGYSYSLATNKPTLTFSLPFIAPAVEWTKIPLVYNRPGEKQAGYAYRLVSGELESAGAGGEALVAKAFYDKGGVLSKVVDGLLRGAYVGSDNFDLAIPAIPEKCVSGTTDEQKMYCSYPIEQSGNLPTDWYKGTAKLQDYLWSIDLAESSPSRGTALLISDLTNESGQNIDATDMSTDYTHTRLLFRDKYTHSLWMYDTTLRNK